MSTNVILLGLSAQLSGPVGNWFPRKGIPLAAYSSAVTTMLVFASTFRRCSASRPALWWRINDSAGRNLRGRCRWYAFPVVRLARPASERRSSLNPAAGAAVARFRARGRLHKSKSKRSTHREKNHSKHFPDPLSLPPSTNRSEEPSPDLAVLMQRLPAEAFLAHGSIHQPRASKVRENQRRFSSEMVT